MQRARVKPTTSHVVLGYRSVYADAPGFGIKHRGKFKTLTACDSRLFKRRQAASSNQADHWPLDGRPPFWALSLELRTRRHFARGAVRGGLQYSLADAHESPRRGVTFFRLLHLRVCQASGIRRNWLGTLLELASIASGGAMPRLAAAGNE